MVVMVPLLLLLAAVHSPSVAVPPTPSSCWRRDRELATPLGPQPSGGRSPPTPPRPLFQPGDCFADGRASVCYRIPALIAAGNRTLLAFAKAMNYSGDQCYPMPFWCGVGCGPRPTASRPVAPGDNSSTIVFRRSDDGGETWSPIQPIVRGVDFEALYDADNDAVLVQYEEDSGIVPQPNNAVGVVNKQIRSVDLGRSWQPPTSLAATLGPYDRVLVGPGRGLQLRSNAKGKKGRLIFCGHRDAEGPDEPGRLLPVWVSDDGGKTYRRTAVLPLNNTGTPSCKGPGGCPGGHQWGPDESQMVELANGDVLMESRNNFAVQTGHKSRMTSLSTDGGEHWGPIGFDDALNAAPDVQASIAKDPNSGAIFFAGPVRVHCSGTTCNGRVNLTVSKSVTDARTWEPQTLLIHGPNPPNSSGGSGYSCLSDIPSRPQEMGLLFERDGAECWYGSSCKMMFTRFPIDFHSPPPPPPPPAPPPSDPSLHRYDGAVGPVVNPERGFRMALYEFPKLNVLEGVGIDDSPLLHGQNVTVTLTMVALNEFSRPFRPISQEYLHDLAEGFANLRKLHVKAIVNVYYNNVFGHNASYNLHAYMPHSFDEVYQHIAQLAPLFHANADVIHALQTGFIGEAGEWVIPNNDKVNSSQLWLSKPGISEMVARQLYELLPPDRMVLIRTPSEKVSCSLQHADVGPYSPCCHCCPQYGCLPGSVPGPAEDAASMANISSMYPDFVWGVVDSKTAHTQKAFARLGYYNAGFMAGDDPKTDGGTWSEEYHSDPRNPWFSYMGRESPYLQMDGEMFGQYGWGYDGRTHGNKGVDGHNATKRFRDHHYTTFSHVNSWAPIDGGPQCSGKPGCAWNLSMNVWEHTPLRFEFLEDWSLPISPAYLAEAKRRTVVVDGKLCSATKSVYDYIGDHLGYRFELTEATFDPVHARTKPLTVAFTVVNRGFSAMHNPRPVYIVLISSASELVFRSPVDASPGDWQPYDPGDPAYVPLEHKIKHATRGNESLPAAGDYRLGLWLPDARAVSLSGKSAGAMAPLLDKEFSVRLANAGIDWTSDGVNVLGEVRLQ